MSSSEHLDSHDGPVGSTATEDRGGHRGRRTGWVVGGAAAVLGVVGAGAWAAMSFLSSGAQPAEALPAGTLAYASIDLDPSGAQKIEALRTLRRFPALRDELHLNSTDDIRRLVFEEVQSSGACHDLDYRRDVEPWLGDRMAVAAVGTGGKGSPVPVEVLQVTDESAARTGLTALVDCLAPALAGDGSTGLSPSSNGDRAPGAFAVADGWALIGASQDVVDRVQQDAAESSLADDGDYQRWTRAAGDPGIASFYVSPAAGDALADARSAGGSDEGWQAFQGFGGLGGSLRFDDGSLELELAGDVGDRADVLAASPHGTDMVRSLPADTVAAAGFGLADGWFGGLVDQMSAAAGTTPERLTADLSKESGLDLPADAETLAGDSLALAVGPGFDPSVLFGATTAPELPVGLKVHGDAAGIERVLDKVRGRLGAEGRLLGSASRGGVVAIGPSEDYRARLLVDGGLGDSEVYRNVVRESDRAVGVVFVNFDQAGWLDALAGADPSVAANLEPLEGLGLSTWIDGSTGHAVLRVTTD